MTGEMKRTKEKEIGRKKRVKKRSGPIESSPEKTYTNLTKSAEDKPKANI